MCSLYAEGGKKAKKKKGVSAKKKLFKDNTESKYVYAWMCIMYACMFLFTYKLYA